MAVSGGELLIDLFRVCDIEYIFCSPGTEWVPVWEGLSRCYGQGKKAPKYINCRHEILAVSAAIGYNKATGRLPAVLLHAGVGPLHAAMAIRTAYLAHVPMIICSGETSGHGSDGEVGAPGSHWLSYLSDMGGPAALINPYVKWSNAVNSSDAMLDSVYRGCQIARAAPPGPVFLAVSRELMIKSLPEIAIKPPPPVALPPDPQPHDLAEVARHLVESKQPIIITEHAGEYPEAVDRLVELAEMLAIPVFECTNPSFANFPRNHPLHMGDDASEALKEADTVLVVRSTTPWYPPSALPQNGTRVILMDEVPWHEKLPYWGYQVDMAVTADIRQGLARLVDIIRQDVGAKGKPDIRYRFEHWRSRHEQVAAQWEKEALAGQQDRPISSRWFFHVLNKVLPESSVILDETLLHSRFVKRYLAAPGRYFRISYGALGVGMGEAAGIKLAYPDRPVIFLVGDGAFNYSPVLAGLGLCQEYNLPVLTMITNNGGYLAMRHSHNSVYPRGWAAGHDAYLGTQIAPQPDYATVAKAFDAYGERLEEPGDIEPAVGRALQQVARGRAALLDIILDTALDS